MRFQIEYGRSTTVRESSNAARLVTSLVDRVRAVPGVRAAGAGTMAIGLAAGVGPAALSVRGMRTVLFGVQPLDGVAFVAAPMLLLAVASAACLIPARRAARIQPNEALRAD